MVDLNLIKVFITIFDTRSVSIAAEHLNIAKFLIIYHNRSYGIHNRF